MKRIAIFLTTYCFLSIISFAQDWKTISGKVINKNTGEPIGKAKITSVDGSVSVLTDQNGFFRLSLSAEVMQIIIEKTGFKRNKIEISTETDFTIALAPSRLQKFSPNIFGASSIYSLGENLFNKGLINDPALLWRGKVAGLGVYKTGDNPDELSHIRVRGLSTLEQDTRPLIVVDGLISASIENVDPNDIASVTVLKDASATAFYGIRGAHGVVIIATKKGKRNSGVNVQYSSNLALSTTENYLPVFDGNEFVAAGGNFLGSETDWQREVTRQAFSQTHHLSISGGTENTIYRASTNLRSVEGILRTNEFEQINVRAGIEQYAWNDRIKGTFNLSFTERESDPGFIEAFRYAITSNPTAPVRFGNGNFYQAIIFDNFNPVAILKLNSIKNTRKLFNFNSQLDIRIAKDLTLTGNFGQQSTSLRNSEFYPSNSFFRGFNRNGFARKSYFDDQTSLLESYLTYSNEFSDKLRLTAIAGYMYQFDEFEDLYIETANFPGNEEPFRSLQYSGDPTITNRSSPRNKLSAFYGNIHLKAGNFDLFAGLRREGSSKLSEKNSWGLFPSFSASMDVLGFVNLQQFEQLNVRLGYGVSGGLPFAYGLSRDRYNYLPEEAMFFQEWEGNPNLSHEKNKEFNIGIDYRRKKLTGTIDFYHRNLEDLIVEEYNRETRTRSYQNSGGLNSRGIELSLGYENATLGPVTWSNYLVVSSSRTILSAFPVEDELIASPGGPGQGSVLMVRREVNEQVGRLWGPVFSGTVDESGLPVFKDLNNDGQVITNFGNALSDQSDFEELGNGLPKWEVGWTQQVEYKNWNLDVFFRGVFGHSKVNIYRMFYEPVNPGNINSYNRVKTKNAIDEISASIYSSLYVENASFVTMDNATLSYKFIFEKPELIRRIKLGITAQNLFTLTNYSGISPDPSVIDPGPTTSGSYIRNEIDEVSLLSPGIERRNTYFRARTFTLNLSLIF